ncbi:hypothetical protein, partial [Klebsiella pneumoniae]|uniref:hypothetical protein n=1 Tax=Klebsiella pneumoniae TaxID=573 RepID=UPI001C6E1A40
MTYIHILGHLFGNLLRKGNKSGFAHQTGFLFHVSEQITNSDRATGRDVFETQDVDDTSSATSNFFRYRFMLFALTFSLFV